MPVDFAFLVNPASWAALAALVAMELVLGVDNLIFVARLTHKVREQQRHFVRRLGLGIALLFRLMLLAALAEIVRLTTPLFSIAGHDFSWRDLIMLGGGLFLVYKATGEIHDNVESRHEQRQREAKPRALGVLSATMQVIALDIVFSIDSIVTAVGMTDDIPIMALAVIIAVVTMLFAAGPLAAFIHRNPALVMLALSFLLMIGMVLIADGFGVHVPKGYIYSAVLFSGAVEALNMRRRSRSGGDGVS